MREALSLIAQAITLNTEALIQISDEMKALRQNAEAIVSFQEWQAGMYRQEREGHLPDGFPGREALEAAGVTSIAAIPRSARQLREIDGIDWPEVTAILSALKRKDES